MKRIFVYLIGVFISFFLFYGSVFPQNPLPQKGRKLPEIKLSVPKDPAHQSYLGLSGDGFFKIPDIKADVVIIEIYTMY